MEIAKGHKVICVFPEDEYGDCVEMEGFVGEKKEGKIFVECFVSGNTEKEGISIVALHNPEWCLVRLYPSDIKSGNPRIKDIESGVYDYWCYKNKFGDKENNMLNPVCPF